MMPMSVSTPYAPRLVIVKVPSLYFRGGEAAVFRALDEVLRFVGDAAQATSRRSPGWQGR